MTAVKSKVTLKNIDSLSKFLATSISSIVGETTKLLNMPRHTALLSFVITILLQSNVNILNKLVNYNNAMKIITIHKGT